MTDDWTFEDQTSESRRASELELLAACVTDSDDAERDDAADPVLQLTSQDMIDHWVTTASGSVYRLVWNPSIGMGFRVRQPHPTDALPAHVGIPHLRDGLRVCVVDVVDLALGRDMVLTVIQLGGAEVTSPSTPVVRIRRAGGDDAA
ncbi:hypothetical protein ACFFOS_13220 [Nocardioides kongjuensis]|uniref:hypothetical protein n=1 Tax=Nocardioides kongjuensis TaxID=349522 RepID=UPI0031E51DF6